MKHVKITLVFIAVIFLLSSFLAAGDSKAIRFFKKNWAEADARFREEFARARDKNVPESARESLQRNARENLVDARVYALEKLSEEKTPDAADLVLDLVFGKIKKGMRFDGRVYAAACDALAAMGENEKVLEFYFKLIRKDREWQVTSALVGVLGEYRDRSPSVLPKIHEELENDAWQVQVAAVRAVRKIRDRSSVKVLLDKLKKLRGGNVSFEIVRALRDLTGQSFTATEEWVKWFDKHGNDFKVAPPEEEPEKDPAVKEWPGPSGDSDEERPVTDSLGSDKVSTTARNPIYGTITSNRVVFIVDISNSMKISGKWGQDEKVMSRLAIVKKELANVIEEQLHQGSKFNIVTFHDSVFSWKSGKLVEATESNKKAAIKFINRQEPSGHTNSVGAIEAALEFEEVDTVYFLSDGTPTSGSSIIPDDIVDRVAGLNKVRNVVINAIAFLVGAPEAKSGIVENKESAAGFMRKLAKKNSGSYRRF